MTIVATAGLMVVTRLRLRVLLLWSGLVLSLLVRRRGLWMLLLVLR
jgi:hypothetical protein